jgi:hypothetical protein
MNVMGASSLFMNEDRRTLTDALLGTKPLSIFA